MIEQLKSVIGFMKVVMVWIFIVVNPVLLLPAVKVHSAPTTYYISCQGNDSNNGTSEATAWRNISKLNSFNFAAGDIIKFQSGCSWDAKGLNLNDSGISLAPIIFTKYGSGAAPVLTNTTEDFPETSTTASDSLGHVIKLTADYNIIDGLTVTNSDYAGINIANGAEHNIIRNTNISNTGIGVRVVGKFNLITKNNIHDLKMVRDDNDGGYNDFGAIGVSLENSDNEVSHNTFINCKAGPTPDYGKFTYDKTDGGAVELFGNTSRSYIHHNYANANEGFIEIGGANSNVITDVKIAYNIVVNSPNRFTYINTKAELGFPVTIQRLLIENNTIVNTRPLPNDVLQVPPKQPMLYARIFDSDQNAEAAKQTFIKNNIVYVNSAVYQIADTGVNSSNNIYYFFDTTYPNTIPYAYKANLGFQKNSTDKLYVKGIDANLPRLFVTNPLPQTPTINDLKLYASDNPAIDGGVNLGYTQDIFEGAVPNGTLPDIGAVEYLTNATAIKCKADYNVSGIVDVSDFSKFAKAYNQNGINCDLDLIGSNCRLDTADFSDFSSKYKDPNACKL